MTGVNTTDRDLLSRFLADRDEESFAELVRRHGPGVWGACRRRLTNPADAEDAFQAAFLVLVRRAGRLRAGTPLGPWLGRVAALTARNVARGSRRRAAVSGPMDHDIAATVVAESPVDLDAALNGLPEADRAAVTLCHLDGLTRKEAAERLGCPEGTLSARLSRALAKLRVRLADEVPPGLARSTVRVAVVFAVSSGSAGVSPAVARLTEEALRMLWMKKLTAAGLVLAAAGVIGVGVVRTADAGGQDKAEKPAAVAEKPPADPVAELVRQLDEAERAVIAAQMRQVLIQGRLQRAREVRAEKAGRTADLTLVILGDVDAGWAARYQLTERAAGKEVFYLTPSAEGLTTLLTRAKADPAGPKTVAVQADPSCKPEVVRAALVAVKAAGFKAVTYDGPLEGDLLGAAKGPGAWHYDRAKRYQGPIDLADLPQGPPAAPKKP